MRWNHGGRSSRRGPMPQTLAAAASWLRNARVRLKTWTRSRHRPRSSPLGPRPLVRRRPRHRSQSAALFRLGAASRRAPAPAPAPPPQRLRRRSCVRPASARGTSTTAATRASSMSGAGSRSPRRERARARRRPLLLSSSSAQLLPQRAPASVHSAPAHCSELLPSVRGGMFLPSMLPGFPPCRLSFDLLDSLYLLILYFSDQKIILQYCVLLYDIWTSRIQTIALCFNIL